MPAGHQTGVVPLLGGEPGVARLAQLFSDAIPVRLPVRVTSLRPNGQELSEDTMIAYGTPSEVLFASTLPLELDDQVRLRNSDGSLEAEAAVVAVQYHGAKKAVAVRFLTEVSNWIIKR